MKNQLFNRRAVSALVILMLVALGCGDKKPAEKTDATPKAVAKDGPKDATEATPKASPKAEALTLPEDPEKMMLAVLKGLDEGDARLLWMALPASYQKDLNGLVSEFAKKMDKDMWNKGFAILAKTAEVADTQKKFILNSQMFTQSTEAAKKEKVAENWDGAVEVLKYLATCELSKLENLTSFDGAVFLASMVEKAAKMDKDKIEALMKSYAPDDAQIDLSKVKVAKIKGDDKSVTMKITSPEGEDDEIVLVKVEGRWVPEDMAKDWAKTMEEAKAGLAQLSGEEMAKSKPQVLAMMAMVESSVDQLKGAKTQEEFDKITMSLAQIFNPQAQ